MPSQLEQLKKITKVVADTGDIEAIVRAQPEDATTNPSLVLKSASLPAYETLLNAAVAYGKQQSSDAAEQARFAADWLAVGIGKEVQKIVPGVISTEVDARLSFDTEATIAKAKSLIALYKEQGADPSRVLIKVASTWEGIKAAEVLEKEGIRCNLTLLFSFAQAQACAEAGVYLISPFVGRILDWYKKAEDRDFTASEDPGVVSVTQIYNYYKQHGYNTVVMGASFRNTDEILELAGCDALTIGPELLDALAASSEPVVQKLVAEQPAATDAVAALTDKAVRWAMNQDAMATEKLAEGIRNFAVDQGKLEALLLEKLA